MATGENKIRVCVAGATGWVGQPLCEAIVASPDLGLVGAISRTHRGQQLKDVIDGIETDVTISGTTAEALETPCDVLVDYTKADVVKSNVLSWIGPGFQQASAASLSKNTFERKREQFPITLELGALVSMHASV